jgi:hypothetical protein
MNFKKIVFFLLLTGSLFAETESNLESGEENTIIKNSKDNMQFFYFGFSPLLGYHYISHANGSENTEGSYAKFDLQIGIKLNKSFTIFVSMDMMFFPMRLGPVGPTPFETPLSQMAYFVSDSDIDRDNGSINLLGGFPIGIIYNIVPENLFISLKLFFPTGSYGDHQFDTNAFTMGFGAAIGKKWFISKRWAIGISLNLHYQYLTPANESAGPFHDGMAGISAGITFN